MGWRDPGGWKEAPGINKWSKKVRRNIKSAWRSHFFPFAWLLTNLYCIYGICPRYPDMNKETLKKSRLGKENELDELIQTQSDQLLQCIDHSWSKRNTEWLMHRRWPGQRARVTIRAAGPRGVATYSPSGSAPSVLGIITGARFNKGSIIEGPRSNGRARGIDARRAKGPLRKGSFCLKGIWRWRVTGRKGADWIAISIN